MARPRASAPGSSFASRSTPTDWTPPAGLPVAAPAKGAPRTGSPAKKTSAKPLAKPAKPAARPASASRPKATKPLSSPSKGKASRAQAAPGTRTAADAFRDMSLRVVIGTLKPGQVDAHERDLLHLLADLVDRFEASDSPGARLLASGLRGLVVLFSMRALNKRRGTLATVFTKSETTPQRVAGLVWTPKVEPEVKLPAPPRQSIEGPDEPLRQLLGQLAALTKPYPPGAPSAEVTEASVSFHATLAAIEDVVRLGGLYLDAPPGHRLTVDREKGGQGLYLKLERAPDAPTEPASNAPLPSLGATHRALIGSTIMALDRLATVQALASEIAFRSRTSPHRPAPRCELEEVRRLAHTMSEELWLFGHDLGETSEVLTGESSSEPPAVHLKALSELETACLRADSDTFFNGHLLRQAARAFAGND